MPKKAVISLQLGENYYIVERGSVKAGKASDPDISVYLPVEYVRDISRGLCYVMGKAEQEGDLWMDQHGSDAAMMWRYKGMLKYKECLG